MASYVVAFPLVRRLQARRPEDLQWSPHEAFVVWLLWPLSLTLLGVVTFVTAVPKVLFPTPQVYQVRERLRGASRKKKPKQEADERP